MWFGIESVQAFTFATGSVGANIISQITSKLLTLD